MKSVKMSVDFTDSTCSGVGNALDVPVRLGSTGPVTDQVDLGPCGLTTASQLADLTLTYTVTAGSGGATGHLVFATLHTNDTSQTLDRIVDVFPAEQQPQIRLQLTHTLVGILNQTLVSRIGGGRVAAFEVLAGTSAIRNMVATGHRDGMRTLEAGINALVAAGTIAYEEAVLHTAYPEEIQRPAVPVGRP